MTDEQKIECKLALANIRRELMDLAKVGVKYQLVFDSDHPEIIVFYTKDEHRKLKLRETHAAIREFIDKVESKGSLTKPELIQQVVKFKKL